MRAQILLFTLVLLGASFALVCGAAIYAQDPLPNIHPAEPGSPADALQVIRPGDEGRPFIERDCWLDASEIQWATDLACRVDKAPDPEWRFIVTCSTGVAVRCSAP